MTDIMTDGTVAALRDEFMYARCYALAAAIHDRTGWPIGVLMADWKSTPSDAVMRRRAVHAYVVTPSGDRLDAMGIGSTEELPSLYFDRTRHIVRHWNDEFADIHAFKECLVSAEMRSSPYPGEATGGEDRIRCEIDHFFETFAQKAEGAVDDLGLLSFETAPAAQAGPSP